MNRIKRITSHTGHARFLDEVDADVGYIPRVVSIPSPYRYSPVESVYSWKGKNVIIKETAHKRFDVFEVPADAKIYADEQEAADVYIGKH